MKIKQELKEVFLHIKPVKMLILLKDGETEWYFSKIAKESGSTYFYVKEIMNILKRENIVKIKEEGRIKKVTYTEKGLELANMLEDFIKKCELKETTEIILPAE